MTIDTSKLILPSRRKIILGTAAALAGSALLGAPAIVQAQGSRRAL